MKNMKWNEWVFVIVGLLVVAGLSRLDLFDHTEEAAAAELVDTTAVETEEVAVRDTTPLEQLQYFLSELDSAEILEHASWGFYLVSVDSGKTIASRNYTQTLVPASVMKAITTAVALAKLGPSYRLNTRLQYSGELDVENRTLNGNIYIKGGGDPTLGSKVFPSCSQQAIMGKWLAAIQKLGIDTINGAIIGDARLFEYDLIPAGWAWEDMQSDYCAGASGLSFRENICDILICCVRDSMRARTEPPIPGLKLMNVLGIDSNSPKNYAYITGSPYMNERFIRGVVRPDSATFRMKGQVPDPAFLCSYTLYNTLKENNIVVKDSCTTVRKMKFTGKYRREEATTFHVNYSPSLLSMINHTNNVSQNFYAETILKTIGVRDDGHGTTAGGSKAVRRFLEKRGIDTGGLFMVDGSGLSRYNAITPKMLVDMLAMFVNDTTIGFDDFYNSLPIAGQTGTLRKLCIGTSAEGNLRAKSGYMGRVRSYAGYVTSKSGELLSFAMIANNYSCSAVEMRDQWEKMMVLMAELE